MPQQVLQATSTAFTNALLRGDMTTATAHCKRIIAIYREVYFQNHPMLGLQLYTLADIERQTDRYVPLCAEALHSAWNDTLL